MPFGVYSRAHDSTGQTHTNAYDEHNTYKLITNMQNHLENHLISAKLRCAPPKYTSVQNYIVNLDLHVRCQPQKTILCVRALVHHLQVSSNQNAGIKCVGGTPTSNGHRSPLCTMVYNAGRWYTTQVAGAQHSPVPTKWCTT